VEPLTPSDFKRRDLDAIRTVFETASGRADTLQRLGENLNQVYNVLADWQGEAGWQVNEKFLRSQMERGVSRIDYVVDHGEFSSVDEVLALRPDSFSAKEITFLKSNAESYGYHQVGDSWVRVTGGQK